MIYSIAAYQDFGKRAAEARNQGNETHAKRIVEDYKVCSSLEILDDKIRADAEYLRIYWQTRNLI